MVEQIKLDMFLTEERGQSKGPRELPEGWKWLKLMDVLKLTNGKSMTRRQLKNEKKTPHNIPVYGSNGIIGYTTRALIEFDTVVIGRVGVYCGVANFAKGPCWISDNAIYVKEVDSTRILLNFLYWLLRTYDLNKFARKSAQPLIRQKSILALRIPLPPLEEQKRIVARVEELVSRVKEAKKLRRIAKEEGEKTMQAALNKVFSKTEEEWGLTKLVKICKINPSKSEIRALSDDIQVTFVPMVAVSEIKGRIEKPEARLLGDVRKGYTYFREKDVLFAKITPCMENGKSAIARNLINGLGFGSTEFHVLRPLDGMLPEWVYYYIRQKSFRDYAARHMTGSVGQQRVPVQFIKNVEIPFPPIEEQKRMVAYLDRIRETVESLKKLQQETEGPLEKMVPAILDRAFKGDYD